MSKNILITGSSRGIGLNIATLLSKAGHKVFITGRNKQVLEKKSSEISAAGYLAGDLTNELFAENLIVTAEKCLGSIDVLVNNAGAYYWNSIEKSNVKEVQKLFRLNLAIPYELCTLVVPQMKKQKWGRIISIGSISGAVGEANASLYSASKAGLIGMTKSLALELAEYGITVNVINPGWVKSDLVYNAVCEGCIDPKDELEAIPQKRWIDPSEIAELTKYLISDSACGVTGQSLNLCCGLSLG